MARVLASQTNAPTPDADYPNSRIKDDTGTGNGTYVSEAIHGDIIQLFQKLLIDAGITANGNPDNVSNGYQFLDALKAMNRQYIAQNYDGSGTIATPAAGEVKLGKNGLVTIEALGKLLATTLDAHGSASTNYSWLDALKIGSTLTATSFPLNGILVQGALASLYQVWVQDAAGVVAAKMESNGNITSTGKFIGNNAPKIAISIDATGGLLYDKGSKSVTVTTGAGYQANIAVSGGIPTSAIVLVTGLSSSSTDSMHINYYFNGSDIRVYAENADGTGSISRQLSVIAYW